MLEGLFNELGESPSLPAKLRGALAQARSSALTREQLLDALDAEYDSVEAMAGQSPEGELGDTLVALLERYMVCVNELAEWIESGGGLDEPAVADVLQQVEGIDRELQALAEEELEIEEDDLE
jgi:hypothetical protein